MRIRNKFGCSASYAAATPQMRETLMKLETCELRNKAQVHKSAAMTGSRVLDSNSKVLSNAEQNELAVEMDSIRDRADKGARTRRRARSRTPPDAGQSAISKAFIVCMF